MNWTVDDVKRYVQKRLRDEQRTRTEIMATATPQKMVGTRNGRSTGYNPNVVTAFFREHGIPEPLYEHQFCAGRKWRFDIAWDGLRPVAIEVQGGIWTAGAHVRGARLITEYEKLNEAAALGWRVLFVTPDQLTTKSTADLVKRCLNL